MTHDHIDRLVRQANPVPDVSALEPVDTSVLLLNERRRTEVQTNDQILVERDSKKTRRGLAVEIAAVAAIVIGALVIFRLTDEAPLFGDGLTRDEAAAVETTTSFLNAFGSFDPDLAASYLHADLLAAEFDGLEGLGLETGFWEAVGFKMLSVTCAPGEASSEGIAVRCPYDYHAIRSDEMGLGPYSGSAWNFTFRDGKIAEATNDIRFIENGFSAQVWQPFALWLATNHPDDAEVMYTDATRRLQRVSEESNRLWEEHNKAYVKFAGAKTTGLRGLPPDGAIPSSPESGELVASMWEHIGAPGSFGNGWIYLYADGRLIWERADPDPTGGWLERRLTEEGVELIRSEIVATGLFDPDQPAPEPNDGFPRSTNGGNIQVRNGDRLVYLNRVVPDLFVRMAELWSWLPAGAWTDEEAKAYVPSRYVACVHSGGYTHPSDVSDHLGELPASARAILAGAHQLPMTALAEVDPANFGPEHGYTTEYCFNLTTQEARILAMTLSEAGVERMPHRWYDGSEVTFILSSEGTLTLWPMLPHGVPAFTGA